MTLEAKHFIEIEDSLRKGAIQAYHENVMMCYEHTDFKSRMVEYLVVVNIAKLLMKWALPKYLQVHLEYSLADFYNGAFPSTKWIGKSIFDRKTVFSKNHNPENNKSARIDIALTSYPFNEGIYSTMYKSLIGIEIKSISKQKSSILKDIHRLSKSLMLIDKIGDNNIQACYSLFYRRLDNFKEVNSKQELEARKEKELNKWNLELNEYKLKYLSLNYSIEPIVVQETHIEDVIHQFPPEHFDYSEVAEQSGLIMCYLIKIIKK